MGKNNYEILKSAILEKSIADDMYYATKEWMVISYELETESTCICSKQNITKCFTITNIKTGETLYPVGSQCIKRFENDEINDEAKLVVKISKMGKTKLKEGKNSGKTFDYLFTNEKGYVSFLRKEKDNLTKIGYKKLIDYCDYKERELQFNLK